MRPILLLSALLLITAHRAQTFDARAPLAGRWDITVTVAANQYPSWVEFTHNTDEWTGRFVGRTGAVERLTTVQFDGEIVRFSVSKKSPVFEGTLNGNRIQGTVWMQRERQNWIATRSPSLKRSAAPVWGQTIHAFNGKDLTGWKPMPPFASNGWRAVNGILDNLTPGANLATEQTFEDFKLHLEYNLAAGSDSGMYLRGRYEIEIADEFGKEPDSHGLGSIYGFLRPLSNPGKKAGEWQSLDATLIGRYVTVELNGSRIIDNQEIPGITGGALDSAEGSPGPILLQGDHGRVQFRNIVVIPAREPV